VEIHEAEAFRHLNAVLAALGLSWARTRKRRRLLRRTGRETKKCTIIVDKNQSPAEATVIGPEGWSTRPALSRERDEDDQGLHQLVILYAAFEPGVRTIAAPGSAWHLHAERFRDMERTSA